MLCMFNESMSLDLVGFYKALEVRIAKIYIHVHILQTHAAYKVACYARWRLHDVDALDVGAAGNRPHP
jgi:hypothetical protein